MATVYNPSITLANFDTDIQANGGVPSTGSAVLTAVNNFLFGTQDTAAVTGYYDDSTNSGSVTIPFAGLPGANLLFGPGAGPNTGVSGPTDQTISASGAVIVLGPGDNNVTDPGGNWIFGGSGDDTITVTGTGDDSVVAGSGPTTILGGTGSDVYWAGGKTSIEGGSGSAPETLIGGIVTGATDTLWGGHGTGNETLSVTQGNNYVQAGFGDATIYGGSGNDTLVSGNPNGSSNFATSISAGSGNQLLIGGRFSNSSDTLVGGAGNDTLEVFQGNNTVIAGLGHNTIYGGTGNDLLEGNTSPTATSFASIEGAAAAGSSETLIGGFSTLSQDTLWGGRGAGNETLSVSQGNNYLQAGWGDATVYGGAGNDTLVDGNPNGSNNFTSSLVGGSGNELFQAGRFANSNDTLQAGSGNDTMNTYQGNNWINSGSGNDTVNFNSGATLNDTVSANSGSVVVEISGDETLSAIPVINHTTGSVTLTFTENGSTQTLTTYGTHVGVNFNS
jgi:Ca2+-binding RTX toxin-like protein